MQKLLKKFLIAYVVIAFIIGAFIVSTTFATTKMEATQNTEKRNVSLKITSDKKIKSVYIYKKVEGSKYVLFYKANPNKNEHDCIIPESKLSTETKTDFKVVVTEEDGTRNVGDLSCDKLKPYPSMNPSETATPPWTASPIPTFPSPSTKPTGSVAPTVTPSQSGQPTVTPSVEPTQEPSVEPTGEPEPSTEPVTPTGKLNSKQAGQVIANCANYLATERKSEFVYGGPRYSICLTNRSKAYKGIKVNGYLYGTSGHYPGKQNVSFKNKYQMDCAGFCNLVVHWSTGLGGESYTNFFGSNGFKKISNSSLGMGKTISKSKAKEVMLPGDIVRWDGHYAMYIGNGKIAEMVNYGKPSLSGWSLHVRDVSVWNGHHDFKCVYRITEDAASKIDVTKVDSKYLEGVL